MVAGFLGAFADSDTEECITFPFLLLGFLHFSLFILGVFTLLDFDFFEGGKFFWGYACDLECA